MRNGHRHDANDWTHIFICSLAFILGLAATALGGPTDYFDREPINTKFSADQPVVNGATYYEDIRQREAPTCSLMASLSAAARSGIDLSKNIKHLGGKNYSVKLFVKGVWTEVKVNFGGWTKYDPAPNAGEFWVALYQRAYLKAFEVDTSDFDCNKWAAVKDGKKTDPDKDRQDWINASISLTTVTGHQAEVWNLDQADAASTIKRIGDALEKKRCVVVVTKGRKDNDLVAENICLVESHAYTVTAASAEWIEVRNPWGRDIPRSLLSYKDWKNGKAIYAFKEGYSDGKDNNPNDGIVRVNLDCLKYFTRAAVTKEDTAASH